MTAGNKSVSRDQSFAVLGSGICGLTMGNLLLDKYPGSTVTIYTDHQQKIVSNVVGAQFYPIWLGDNVPKNFGNVLRRWFLYSKAIFAKHSLANMGISHMRNHELFRKRPNLPAYFHDVLSNLKIHTDPHLPMDYTHRLSFDTMIIHPLVYLPHITKSFIAKGGKIVKKRINSSSDITKLKEPVVFNCLGMGAQAIFGDDSLKPVKGVILRLKPIEMLNTVISAEDHLIAPRKIDLYLGVLYKEDWKTIKPTAEETSYVFESNKTLLETPGSIFSLPKGTLKKENIIDVRSGFRPVRDKGPRVEKEQLGGKTVIHNYGHGGNGFILSWGTAAHALELLEKS